MKTAMNELKERLLEIGFADVESFIEEYVEKEKQHIIDAVKYGQNNSSLSLKHEEEIAKNYYTKTFEKK